MKTELVHLGGLLLGGVSFFGDPFRRKGGWDSDNEIGNTCRRYGDIIAGYPELVKPGHRRIFYEVHIYGRETPDKGYFEVFAGEEVATAELPMELLTKYIPASDYLKVTLTGKEITEDWWKKIEEEQLPKQCVVKNDTYIIQAYDERFKGMDQIDASEMDAYIPVSKV
jgi:predicted transcriptional regulator YdeE